MKKSILYLINIFTFITICIFFIHTQTSNAIDDTNEKYHFVDVNLLDVDYSPVSEGLEGEQGYLNLKLSIDVQVNSDDKIEISIPKEITISQKMNYELKDEKNNNVGYVTTDNNTLLLSLKSAVTKGSILNINNISCSLSPVLQTNNEVIDFGNNIKKNVLVHDVGDGNFNWISNPMLDPINDVDYWTQHILITNYRVMSSNEILKDSPNYRGVNPTPGYRYPAYYFFGHNKQGNYLQPYFATCVDLFHTIGIYQNGKMQYSDMTEYIEPEAVYRLNLYMQMAIMLAEENGMVINTNGDKVPIEFTSDEQQAYMFAGQYLGWQQSLMYNKNPDYRINNVSTDTLKPVSKSGSPVDISKYINDITGLFDLYNNTEYISNENVTLNLNKPQNIVSIPDDQQKFIHYIDKEASKNLNLIDGLQESDFENFKELTITPNQKFEDQQVQIVVHKKPNTYWNNLFNNTGLRYEDSAVQYKGLVGLLDSEVKTEVITLSMDDKTEIKVQKNWNDSNNQDGKRPNSINVQLYGNDKEVGSPILLNEGNDWTTTWEELPEKEAGKTIVYTVKEVDTPAGYESSVNDQDKGNIIITNTHVPEKTSLAGTKTWNDSNNQDGKRPEKISVNLLANGEVITSKEVTEKDNWTYSFTDLDKFKDGEEITYTVTENSVPEYSTEISGSNLINSYTPGKTSVTVTKAWNDSNNQDGKRPSSINVQLYGNDKEVGSPVLLNEGNDWTTTWEELPEKEAGKTIVYTVKEVDTPAGYESSVNDQDKGNIIITNTHVPEKTSLAGTKTWNDSNNQDGKRPEKISVNLLANGEVITSKEVTEKDNWTYSFTDLDKFKDGEEITYTVTENSVPEYSTEISGSNLINSYTPGKTSVTVTKAWNDSNNQDGKRPSSINVQLYGNDKEVGSPVLLNEGNDWTTTWEELPEKEAGKTIVYTVKEVDTPAGYESSVNDQDKGNIIITNTHVPEKTSLAGTKTWNDSNNQDGKRPEKISVNLLANGEVITSKEVTEKDNWTYSFTDLDKFKDGEEITYTVTENSLPEYSTEISGSNLINSYTPGKTSVTVTKAWNDSNNQDGKRPSSINVQLYGNDKEVGSPILLNEGNDWTTTWEELPEKEAGKTIVYTVKEVDTPAGYESSVNDQDKGNIIITNTHVPEKTSLAGTKTWNDSNNQDGKRPEKISVNLLANGEVITSKEVTEKDNWTYSFTDLDKFKDGEEITYTVTENSVPEYSTEISGSNLINSYTPGKTSVTVTKAWNDSNNQDGKRPSSINVQLYGNDKEVGSPVLLNEGNDWTTTWEELPEKEAGKTIVYTVKEVDTPAGYESSINDQDKGNIIITNNFISEKKVSSKDSNNNKGKSGSYPLTGETTNMNYFIVGILLIMVVGYSRLKYRSKSKF